jgi:hypothetical protein
MKNENVIKKNLGRIYDPKKNGLMKADYITGIKFFLLLFFLLLSSFAKGNRLFVKWMDESKGN